CDGDERCQRRTVSDVCAGDHMLRAEVFVRSASGTVNALYQASMTAQRDTCATRSPRKRETAMYTHLLVPLDGSERAEHAVPVAERIARTLATRGSGSHITLMQAISVPLPIGAPYDTAALSAVSMEQTEEQASVYLTRIAGWPLLSGLGLAITVVTGGP